MDSMKRVTLFCILIALAVAPVFAEPEANLIRVGLTSYNTAISLTVTAEGGISISQQNSNSLIPSGSVASASVDLAQNKLTLTIDDKPAEISSPIVFKPFDLQSVISISSPGKPVRTYRGSLEISAGPNGLRLINIVNSEDYLLGVLPLEMGDSYPENTLKAQAITARTYIYANINKHSALGCNVCDSSTCCQLYGGVMAEKPRCSKVILDTCGQVLDYKGKPASVMYSTDCGGITRDCGLPYMCSITEPEDIKHIEWRQEYKLSDLETRLTAGGIKEASGLKSVSVEKTDPTQRAVDIEITGGSSSTTITAFRLQKVLGYGAIKSVLFTVEQKDSDTLVFRGKGWGHGRGLCQVGAKALALPPHNLTYDQILAHYFPGTQIQTSDIAPASIQTPILAKNTNSPTSSKPVSRKKSKSWWKGIYIRIRL